MKALMLVAMLVLLPAVAHSKDQITEFGYRISSSYNLKAVNHLVMNCVSSQLADMQADAAVNLLTRVCTGEVLAGRWNGSSIRLAREKSRRDYYERRGYYRR